MDFELLVGIFPQVLLDGLILGFMYALIALGYTMVYGVLEFINFAHSEIFVVGAFVGVEILLSLQSAGWLERVPWILVLLAVFLQDAVRLVESIWRNAFNLVYPPMDVLNERFELTSTIDVSVKSLVVIVAALLM